MENLPFLAFWAYNTTLLLHLLKTDKELSVVCEEYGYLAELEGLINAIQGELFDEQPRLHADPQSLSSE